MRKCGFDETAFSPSSTLASWSPARLEPPSSSSVELAQSRGEAGEKQKCIFFEKVVPALFASCCDLHRSIESVSECGGRQDDRSAAQDHSAALRRGQRN